MTRRPQPTLRTRCEKPFDEGGGDADADASGNAGARGGCDVNLTPGDAGFSLGISTSPFFPKPQQQPQRVRPPAVRRVLLLFPL